MPLLSRATRTIALLGGGAMLAAACGGAGTQDVEVRGPAEDPTPTAEVEQRAATSTVGDVLGTLDPEAGYERLIDETDPLPLDGGELALCEDIPELEATIEGSISATANMSDGLSNILVNYWTDHLDTFGGMWTDRAHGGAIVLTFTDEPGPHQQAIAELTNAPVEVLQVPFTQIELRATQRQLVPLMGPEFGLVGLGSGTTRNRVSLDLVDPPDGTLEALAELVPTAAVCVSVSFTPEPPTGPLKVIPEPGEDDPLVSCFGVPPVPYSTLINPPSIDTVNHPAVDALRAALAAPPGEPLPTGDWTVIAIEGDSATFAALSGDGFGTAKFNREGEAWVLSGWGYGGECDPVLALPDGLGQVAVWLDPDSLPEPTDTVIDLLVAETDCAGGRQMDDALLGPQIVETKALVLVAFAVTPVTGVATCQGNRPTSVSIELSEPLGDRIIADGLSVPPQPLTDEPY